MLTVVTNPSLKAGKEALEKIQDKAYKGYIRTAIETLFTAVDQGVITFKELGTTELTVIDHVCEHINLELSRNCSHTFSPYLQLRSKLEERRGRHIGAQSLPNYADNVAFTADTKNNRVAA